MDTSPQLSRIGIGLIGRKLGMTRLFITEEGSSVPVTVIEVPPNRVVQQRVVERDGYSAVQLTVGKAPKAKSLSRPLAGHFERAGVTPGRRLHEFRISDDGRAGNTNANETEGDGGDGGDVRSEDPLQAGAEIALSQCFVAGQKVDVSSRSKGKGFQGGIKRWNFHSQDATHGNSLSHRSNGSIGQCQTPGRVWKGKKMSGHMGDRRVTTQNLRIERVDPERQLLLLRGAVPGAVGAEVLVRPATKTKVHTAHRPSR